MRKAPPTPCQPAADSTLPGSLPIRAPNAAGGCLAHSPALARAGASSPARSPARLYSESISMTPPGKP